MAWRCGARHNEVYLQFLRDILRSRPDGIAFSHASDEGDHVSPRLTTDPAVINARWHLPQALPVFS